MRETFLDGRLADATIDANRKAGTIERFVTGSGDDIDVHVKSVTLEDLHQPPYRATVEFEKVYLSPATRAEVRRETYIAHVVFVLKDHVDNARTPINPLGLTIYLLPGGPGVRQRPRAAPMIATSSLVATPWMTGAVPSPSR